MQCPSCQAEVVPEAIYCPHCGTRLDMAAEERTNGIAPTPVPPSNVGRGRLTEAVEARQDDDLEEQLLWEGGYSGKAMVGTWLVCGVLTAVAVVVAALYNAPASVWLVILAGIVLIWSAAGLLLLYRKLNVRYQLTTQRFVHESGILRRVTDRIEVIDMDDITFDRGLIERLLNVGNIRIDSSDRSHPQFVLRGIEDVAAVATMIDNARRKERVRRGLHIEAV